MPFDPSVHTRWWTTHPGKADLLWHNRRAGDLYVWFLDGTVVTRGSYLTPKGFTDRSWKVVPQ